MASLLPSRGNTSSLSGGLHRPAPPDPPCLPACLSSPSMHCLSDSPYSSSYTALDSTRCDGHETRRSASRRTAAASSLETRRFTCSSLRGRDKWRGERRQ